MANVLPTEEKKRVLRDVRSRFVLTAACVLLTGALIATACLSPAVISVMLAINGLPQEEQLSDTTRDDQIKQARAVALVAALNPIISATTTPSSSVIAALSVKPAGVSVTSLSYSKGRLLLSGVSRDRQAVNDYRELLEADPRFITVAVPVAALVGTQDGRFTITLSGNF